ncbi:MAG: thioredoxin family protein [Candidatus Eisenbacteria bacterium]|nr:thioredoxin family protein [Candidatus Eisenbacteria bacterium]
MPNDDIKAITIAGTSVGMMGLNSVFGELKASGKEPSDELGTALVEMARKHNYIPDAARAEYARALLREYRRYLGQDVPEEKPQGLSIKILGMGCSSCEALASNVRSALTKLNVAAEVEHVREPRRIAECGVLGVPALIINGKVVSVGKALSTEQVIGLLEKLKQDS